ncbi:unnamed protein product [Dibothriocephalus latus]|uniref:P-type domain-containing protein n=1 Tax=Dibothriocephalus latus TaxID=60516 RepID=A0A3P7LPB5_DIBLA|nr:unnamed protein product [Dibothriocephalus latus]
MAAAQRVLCAILGLFTWGSGQPASCSSIPTLERMDCYPEPSATEERCLERGCCWELPADPKMNACYLPIDYPAYSLQNTSSSPGHYTFYLQKQFLKPPFANELAELKVDFIYETASRLRLRITDPHQQRWEPPVDINQPINFPPKAVNYRVSYDSKPFGFKVYRKAGERGEDHLLVDTTGLMASSLIARDAFWQIAFKIVAQRGFGPGERRTAFPLRLRNWERVPMWAQDQPPMEHVNLYGVHNFFLGLTVDGIAFGIFLLNSNAQEIDIQPMPSLTYRTIGGILDFFIFVGPKPQDVVSQYLDLIGRPPLPLYWALGFHLSRYGFRDLADVQATDWTVDPVKFADFGQFIRETIHSQNDMHTVIMFDAAIQANPDYEIYRDGLHRGVYINDSRTGGPIQGSLWPGTVVYPDYGKQETVEWVYDGASKFHEEIPFDGLWIDMNEPSNFVDGSLDGCIWNSPLDHPPYQPRILGDLLYRAKLDGRTVARALALEYPKDLACHSIDKQFLWGSCLLITPVLEQGARGIYGYLPQGEWIGLNDHLRHKSKGEWFYFEAPLEQIPLHVKAGCVLPMHLPTQTINQAREKGIGILVVLKEEDSGYPWSRYAATAWGEFFWDDGVTETQAYTYITFSVAFRKLTILPRVVRLQSEDKLLHSEVPLAFIKIVGISKRPRTVSLNQQRFAFTHDVKTRTLFVEAPPNSLLTTKTQLTWSFK